MANSYIPVRLEYSGGSNPTGFAEVQNNETVLYPDGVRIKGDLSTGAGGFANRLFLQSSVANAQTQISVMPNGSSQVAGVQLWSSSSNLENSPRGDLFVDGSAFTLSSTRSGSGAYLPFALKTSDIERGRVSPSGEFMWGGSSSNPIASKVNQFWMSNAGSVFLYQAGGPSLSLGTNSTSFVNFWYNGLTAVGSIATNGTTTSYNTSSDYRLKENVQDLDQDEAAARIMAYRPVTWTWSVDGSPGKGFIAHECQAVDPSTATGVKDAVEQVGDVRLEDGSLAAESVREPEDCSIYGDGATWHMTAERPVYQGRDDTKMIPDMVAMMQRMELRIRDLEAQLLALQPAA